MTKVTKIEITNMTEEDKAYYQQFYPKHRVTGELFNEHFNAMEYTDHIILKGRWTPHGCVRDCGDHYIIARYSQYDRIDKDTFKIIEDVEDR